MRRFIISLLSLAFAFQPVFASAATLTQLRSARNTVTVRPSAAKTRVHSPRLTRQMYDQQNAERTMRHPSYSSSANSPYAPIGDIIPALPAGGLSMGSLNAPVTIVEFTDYECPYCATFNSDTFPTIKKRYIDAGNVRFVLRNFPLEYHAYALPAAEAVQCARNQGDAIAWKLSDAILNALADGKDFTFDERKNIIQSIPGINYTDVVNCADNKQKQSVIDQDIKDAKAGGIPGDPSFWVLGPNGKAELIQGSAEFETFQKVLDMMLK